MKNILITFLILTVTIAFAQEKKFYEFGWKENYGIVDKEGNEIVEPIYDWVAYTLQYKSPFIALNSRKNGALTIYTETGKIEKFTLFHDAHLIEFGSKEYIYATKDEKGFLLDNFDLNLRIELPKKYEDLRQAENYLIGYTNDSKEAIVDFISIKDFKIKKENLSLMNINSYQDIDSHKFIYVIGQGNLTLFLDDNLKELAIASIPFTSFEEIQKFLLDKTKMKIVEKDYPIQEGMAVAPNYPHIDGVKDGQYAVYNIYKSRSDFQPFFKFRQANLKVYDDAYDNKVVLEYANDKLFALFYTDIETKKVLLPKKYWDELDLQLIP